MRTARGALGVLALGLLAGPAMAADLPMPAMDEPPAPIAAPAPAFSWTGIYLGAHGGGIWGTLNMDDVILDLASLNPDDTAFMAGGQLGANWQNGMFVFGGEVDASWVDNLGYSDPANTSTIDPELVETKVFGTARGRVGVALDRLLVYGTGGLAAAYVEATDTDGAGGTADNVLWGYAAGGGVEYAVTDRILVRGEAMYYDLGQENFNMSPGNDDTDIGMSGVVARGGVSFKFP